MTPRVRRASIEGVSLLANPIFQALAGGLLLSALGYAAIQLLT